MNVTHNIADLNQALSDYQVLSRKSMADVMAKQGAKLAWAIKRELRSIVPASGSIRSRALAILKSGGMIKIRESVKESVAAKREAKKFTPKGKLRKFKLNLAQEMIRREIAVRESGRGVLSVSAAYPGFLVSGQKAVSRAGLLMSEVGLKAEVAGGRVSFVWPGMNITSKGVVRGLQSPRGSAAVATAIAKTTADITSYVRRKQSELMAAAIKKTAK